MSQATSLDPTADAASASPAAHAPIGIGETLCGINLRAQQCADAANVAYWTRSAGSNAIYRYQMEELRKKFADLAALIGTLDGGEAVRSQTDGDDR